MSDETKIPDWVKKNVSRGTLVNLASYVALLLKWNSKINLIGSRGDVWNRHIWDCCQLVEHIPSRAKTLIDLGSGAGLPGLVIAMATSLHVTLVERDIRKASFLREAARTLGLKKVEVKNEDAHFISGKYDVVTARALSSLADLCELAFPLLGKSSICLFPKGEKFATEVAEAGEKWSFDLELIPSRTSQDSSIVSLSKLKKNTKD